MIWKMSKGSRLIPVWFQVQVGCSDESCITTIVEVYGSNLLASMQGILETSTEVVVIRTKAFYEANLRKHRGRVVGCKPT